MFTPMLRRHERFVCACAGMGLALVALLVVSSPTALAALEDPKQKPQALWEAFPLNPTDERLNSAKQPVLKPPVQGRPEATKAEEVPARTSRSSVIVFALFAGATLLALGLVGFLSMRRLHLRIYDPRPSVAAWEGISWPNPDHRTRQEREPRAEQGMAAAVGAKHPAAGLHPDVPAATYRLQRLERPRRRRSRVTGGGRRAPFSQVLVDRLAGIARRMKAFLWTEQTAPVIVGATLACIAGFLIIHWAG